MAPRGEAQHLAKLTRDQVLAMRRLKGSMSHEKIGAHFGISQTQTSRILRGECWRWL